MLQLVLVLDAEDIVDQCWDGVAAEPEELSLAIIEKVETERHNVCGGKVEGRRHGNGTCLRVWKSSIVRHVVQGVKARVDVLDEERKGKSREKAEGSGAQVRWDLGRFA